MTATAASERRTALILFAPLLAGMLVPWAAWVVTGKVVLWVLVAATAGVSSAYLICVQWLGGREQELRRRLGRRYEPPPRPMAAAVCFGLAGSLLAPGLSVQALAAAVGYPRLAGDVQEYRPADLLRTGARIALAPQTMPLGSSLVLLRGGTARMAVPRFGEPVVFEFRWRPEGDLVCLARWCFALDPATGRLRVPAPGGMELGRVAVVGADRPEPASRSGAPWEVRHLFTDAALLR